jgi:succinoglycan biosynthesis transport protein ExoP
MPVQSDRSSFQHNGHVSPPSVAAPPPSPTPDQDDLDFTHLVHIARRRLWAIAGVGVAVTSAIWIWTLTRTPEYRGEFRVLIEPVGESNRSQQLLLDDQIQLRSTTDYETQIEVLRSPALLRPIAETLQARYPEISSGYLATHLSITRLRDTKVLAVGYRDPDPEKIEAVLSEVSKQYLDYSFEKHQSSLQQGIQFVDDQLPELQERVNTLQVRLERFRQEYSIFDPESRGSELSGLMTSIESQQQSLQSELTEARSLYETLSRQIGYTPDQALAASTLSESSRYQALLNQLQDIEAEIAVESARFQSDSPQIEALEERRDNLLPLLNQEATRLLGDRLVSPADAQMTATSIDLSRQLINAANKVQMLEARSQTLQRVDQELKQEFGLVPALARQYTDLQRELAIATESLNRFLATRETLQIDASQKSVPWQLISEPTAPRYPISPNVPRNLMMGIIAGLLAGTAAALVKEKLDNVFHSPEDLKVYTKRPTLGVIPFLPDLHQPDASVSLFSSPDEADPLARRSRLHPKANFRASVFSEAFRSLYANIRFLGADQPIRSLVISSAIPSEGKSTIALHLAKAAAVMGHRVLLVDADLRSPKHHTRLNLPNSYGLSNAISEHLSLSQIIQRSPLDDNMFVVTGGPMPPDPVKLLSSQRIQNLMDEMKQHFDLIIYDTPPLLGFADSNLLAAHTDGMVVVVGLGRTDRIALGRALDDLKLSPVSVLGMVANGIKSHTTQSYGYYRYYKHYYSSSSPSFSSSLPSPHPPASSVRHTTPPSHSFNLLSPNTALAERPLSSHNKNGNYSNEVVATLNTSSFSFSTMQPWMWTLIGIIVTFSFGVAGWMAYGRLSGQTPSSVLSEDRPSTSQTSENLMPSIAPVVDDPFAEAVRIAQEASSEGPEAQTAEDWYFLAVQWKQASDLMGLVPPDDSRYDMAQDRMRIYRQNSEYAYEQIENTSP